MVAMSLPNGQGESPIEATFVIPSVKRVTGAPVRRKLEADG